MSMDKERAENKVRKLMALAKDHGASEQEAESALRQANALIQKHQIQLADLLAETKAAPTFDWGRQFVAYGRYGKTTWEAKITPTWFDIIAVGVGRFTDCITRKHVKSGLGSGIGFYGETADVEMAVWMLEYLRDTVFWLAHDQKDLDRGGKESFRRGMAARLQKRLFDLRSGRDAELAAAQATGTALVVVAAKMEQRDTHFGMKVQTKAVATRCDSGYWRGNAAAEKVGLHRVISPAQNQARLS